MMYLKKCRGVGWKAFGMVTWDWIAQPNWQEINCVISYAGLGRHPRYIQAVETTDYDEFAVIIADRRLTAEECQEAYRALSKDEG